VSLVRTPIGEILLRHEHLRPRELDRLLAEDRKQRLVSMLILRAEIELDDGTLALSEQSGYPGALERHLEQRDGSLVRGFPQALMRNFAVVPLTRTAAGALVVIARDPSPALADHLRRELGQPIELAITPAIFIERLLQRLAPGMPDAAELPVSGGLPPARHRKSISAIMNAPLVEPVSVAPPVEPPPIPVSLPTPVNEPVPAPVVSTMPMVELPPESAMLIQPAMTLELDDDDEPPEPAPEAAPVDERRPNRPTRPIPGSDLQPLLAERPSTEDGGTTIITNQPATEDPGVWASTRPTRPAITVPTMPDERPSPPVRATPNIIKRPPTPLPIAQPPIARVIVDDPEPAPSPAEAQVRPTYPKLEPPPPSSVFEAETLRPHKAHPVTAPKPVIPRVPKPPPAPPTPPEPEPPPVRARSTTDNWDDFEDSKVGLSVPPPDALDEMSEVGFAPPVEPIAAIQSIDSIEPPRPRPPSVPPEPPAAALRARPASTPPRPPSEPPVRSGTQPLSAITRPPAPPRLGTEPPRAETQPPDRPSQPALPPLPPRPPGTPPPIPRPGENIVRDIEKALSRATADRLLMKHVATRWSSLLLVNIADDRAKGARGHGGRLQAGVEAIDLEIATSSLLQAACDPSIEPPSGKDPLVDLLGGPTNPSSAPVVVEDRVVAVLAAGDAIAGVGPDELPSLARALAVAYQRFPLK